MSEDMAAKIIERAQADRFVQRNMCHLAHVDVGIHRAVGLHREERFRDCGARGRPAFLILHCSRIYVLDVHPLGETTQQRAKRVGNGKPGFRFRTQLRRAGLSALDPRR